MIAMNMHAVMNLTNELTRGKSRGSNHMRSFASHFGAGNYSNRISPLSLRLAGTESVSREHDRPQRAGRSVRA